jgi:hypothetical protein
VSEVEVKWKSIASHVPSRRGFISGLSASVAVTIAAPAMVRASSLMPVRASACAVNVDCVLWGRNYGYALFDDKIVMVERFRHFTGGSVGSRQPSHAVPALDNILPDSELNAR